MESHNCLICSKEFQDYRSAKRKYCSTECRDSSRKGYHKLTPNFICKYCKEEKPRNRKPYGGINYKQKYCCRKCVSQSRIIPHPTFFCEWCKEEKPRQRYYKQNYNYRARFCSLECSYNARRTGFISEGYRMSSRNGKRISDHRFIMEKCLKRALYKHETIHHKNGDKLDNTDDNLELWSKSHPYGQRVVDKIKWAKQFLEEYGYKIIEKKDGRRTTGFMD